MWYIHTVEYSATKENHGITWMDLKHMPTESNQTQKISCGIILSICKVQNIHIKQTRQVTDCQGLGSTFLLVLQKMTLSTSDAHISQTEQPGYRFTNIQKNAFNTKEKLRSQDTLNVYFHSSFQFINSYPLGFGCLGKGCFISQQGKYIFPVYFSSFKIV